MDQVAVTEITAATDDVVETQVALRLHATDHKKVLSTKQDLGKVASYLVEQYAKGGVMLRAAQAHYLEQVSGMPIKTAETIISIVESGINRHSANGNLTVSYSVDPAFAQPLEDLAAAQGRSVEEIVQEGFQIVLSCGWLYSLDTGGLTLRFTPEDTKELQRLIGLKTVTGSDFVSWAKNIEAKAQKSSKIGKVRAEVQERLEQIHAEVSQASV